MPTFDLQNITGSGAIIYIAGVIIAIQVLYFSFKLFRTYDRYGELSWQRVFRALVPIHVSEQIYDGFVILILLSDLARLILSKEGLPISAMMFVTVLLLFVATNSLERYRAGQEVDEVVRLRRRVAELEAAATPITEK